MVEKNERSGGVGWWRYLQQLRDLDLEISYVDDRFRRDDGELQYHAARFLQTCDSWEVLGPFCTTQHIAANSPGCLFNPFDREQRQRLSKATCALAAVARGRGDNLMPARGRGARHRRPLPRGLRSGCFMDCVAGIVRVARTRPKSCFHHLLSLWKDRLYTTSLRNLRGFGYYHRTSRGDEGTK